MTRSTFADVTGVIGSIRSKNRRAILGDPTVSVRACPHGFDSRRDVRIEKYQALRSNLISRYVVTPIVRYLIDISLLATRRRQRSVGARTKI